MNLVRFPRPVKALFPSVTWEIRDSKPSLYLTFDDGPTPVITAKVLDILEQYQAKATFFCIGRNVERHPDIFRQIVSAGHATGNHTYSHLKGWFTPDSEYYADIALAANFVPSTLYRPAYGMITPGQLLHLRRQYRIVLWSIMSYDFAYNTSPQQCLKNVIHYARPGSVIVFHDSLKASEKVLYALPRVLKHFAEQGYHFKVIPA
ncbi:MAG: polysaccharide deacetylase family protein [Bacteroidales bacterium]|nr:polysaccharide deacetylase family protein [Bacteroidales bacterium]